ncbi:MAG: class I SAM-dependent methyltransferase [Treponema sp.]|jgi:ubiquinone/menaquinone biosynthesis C-methylase UbiE|nr:class I SAM-dependent methyltransferase [Treponema sp.]
MNAHAEAPVSRFEGLADWYEQAMSSDSGRKALRNASNELLKDLIGPGSGTALDIGCGTGTVSDLLRELGYDPIGVDLAADQLRIAVERLPVVQADAANLPFLSGSIPLAYSTYTTGAYDDLQRVLKEIARVLKPGGRYVEITTHPCFNGGYAELQADGSVIVRPGYQRTQFLQPSHFKSATSTIRSRVGAWNRSLEEEINVILKAGLQIVRVTEGGSGALPDTIGIFAVKPKEAESES